MSGKTFHFRLEAVLKLRKLEAEKAKAELADAVRLVVASRRALEKSQHELNELLTMASGGTAITDLRRFAQARSEALDRTESFRYRLKELELAELAAKERLSERMRDFQALEDLRESQYQEHLADVNHAEQLALDEFGITRFGRTQPLTAH